MKNRILAGLVLTTFVSVGLSADSKADKAFNDLLDGKIVKLTKEAIAGWDKRSAAGKSLAYKNVALIKTETEAFAKKGSIEAMCQIVFTNGLTGGQQLPDQDINLALKWLIELDKRNVACDIDKDLFQEKPGVDTMTELQYYIYAVEELEGSPAKAQKKYSNYSKAKAESIK